MNILTNKQIIKLRKRVGDNLRYTRLRKKLTQKKLAKLIGVSQYHISRIEWGDQNLKLPLIFKLSKILNIMPGELLDTETPARFYNIKIKERII